MRKNFQIGKISIIPVLLLIAAIGLSGCTGSVPQQKTEHEQDLQDINNASSKDFPAADGTRPVDNPAAAGSDNAMLAEANRLSFVDYSAKILDGKDIPVLCTADGSILFIMKVTGQNPFDSYKNKTVQVLKGETSLVADIYRVKTSTGEKKRIAAGVPYVTSAKMNRQGDKAAFCGHNRLTVYDIKQNRLLLTEELKNDSIKAFGWSPDGNSIYTEHPNLPCGSIIQLGDKKLVHAYETDQRLYYAGMLDDTRFFGTERLIIDEKKQKESGGRLDEYRTVLLNTEGAVVKELSAGIFRDSYGNSFLQSGLEGFGLYLVPSLEMPDDRVKLTDEYVYDAEFIFGGYTVFITKSQDVESNTFLLTAVNHSGTAVAQAMVSGSCLALAPDGKTGCLNGPAFEHIYFTDFIKSAGKEGIACSNSVDASVKPELEGIYKAIRGSMDIYFKKHMLGDEDYNALEKYYTNSSDPMQCALSDMKNIFNEMTTEHYADFYSMDLHLTRLSVSGNRASAGISGSCRSSAGSGMGMGHALELIKKDDKWFVTGMSTFPGSAEYKKVSGMLKNIINGIKSGKLFEGKLKGKEITAGQIQFWQLSDPHLAEEAGHANYCKIFLNVEEAEGSKLYKLVLDKKNYRKWTPVILDGERLSGLF